MHCVSGRTFFSCLKPCSRQRLFVLWFVLQKHLELIRVQTGVMRNQQDGTHGLMCLLDEQQPGLMNSSSIHIQRICTSVGHGTEDKGNRKGAFTHFLPEAALRTREREANLANTARRTPSRNNQERKRWREWCSVTPLICHQLEEMVSSASSSAPAESYSEWLTARRRHLRAPHPSDLNQI